MIQGKVNARREARVRLRLRGAGGQEVDVDAIIDTGFSGALTLPTSTVTGCGLLRQASSRAVMANGATCQYDLYAAEVDWNGTWRPVLVSAVGSESLPGMRLLAGHELRITVTTDGLVEIAPAP